MKNNVFHHVIAAVVSISILIAAALIAGLISFGVSADAPVSRKFAPFLILLVALAATVLGFRFLKKQGRGKLFAGWFGGILLLAAAAFGIVAGDTFGRYWQNTVILAALVLVGAGFLFLGLRKSANRADDPLQSDAIDWIDIKESLLETTFSVRQRTYMRLARLAVLLLLVLVCGLVIWNFFWLRSTWDSVVTTILTIFLPGLIALTSTMMALAGLFPALAALGAARRVIFSVDPQGVIIGAKGKRLPMDDVVSLHWETKNRSILDHDNSLFSDTYRAGLGFVLNGSRSSVYVDCKGRNIHLARLLNEPEARYLSEKLGAAIKAARTAAEESAKLGLGFEAARPGTSK